MAHEASANDNYGAGLVMGARNSHIISLEHIWTVECFDKDGNLKWEEVFKNLVTTEGKNTYLDYTVKTGQASPAWYVGLKGTGAAAVGDVMSSHAGWAEITPYSDATRPAYTAGTISGGSVNNSASKAVFNINATSTVYGAFMSSNNTKSGTTGLLLCAGDFSASRSVADGDTLNVQIDLTIS